jgi:proteasome activator-like protein
MEAAQDTISPCQDQEAAAAGTPLRYVVIVGEHSDDGSAAYRIEDPARLLRVYSLLQATFEQLQGATLPSEGMPGLQRQLEVIRRETERAVSPALAAELRRILPAHDPAPSVGALRIEFTVLVSWVASLIVQMLAAFAAAGERWQRVSTGRDQR